MAGRILCGADIGHGLVCMIAAGPDHDHEAWAMARDEELLNEAAAGVTDPVPGLYEALTGEPLPSFGEMRERYGDPEHLKPIPTAADVTVHQDGTIQPHTMRIDFREMLRDDPGAIITRDRLAHVLVRPYLATQLVEHLPRDVSARLADRLESLVHEAVERNTAAIGQSVAHEVNVALERMDAAAEAKREELRRERFNTPSRFA